MVKLSVQPLKKVGSVEFGMKREKVRELLGEAKEFKKSKFSKTTTDDFGYCHVFYDMNDKCEAIEIFEEVEVEIDGRCIFPVSINEAKSLINDLLEEEDSLISKSQSVGIYAPSGKMESILFGNKNYYE